MRKKTVQELASGSTTTSSTGISSVQAEEWLAEVIKYAKQRMFFEQFATVADLDQGLATKHIPLETANLSLDVSTAEATARTMTQLDHLSTADFTPSEEFFGVEISKEAMRTSGVDLMANAREQLGYGVAVRIEEQFASALAGATPVASLYGGDATSTATLEAGDVLTPDLVADGLRELKSAGWQNENDKPFVLFIAPENENALLKDSQFVNASEYGNNQVIQNGEIGSYLGVRVIENTFVTSSSTYGSGSNLDGHNCFMLKAKTAYGIVYGERPTLDSEYEKDEAAWKIYLDVAYDISTIQEDAIVHIFVVDA